MKYSFAALFLMATLTSFAQRDKEIQLRIGAGAALYSTESNVDFKVATPLGNFPFNVKDDGSAATIHLPLELRYEIIEHLNIGLDAKLGSYLYEDEQDQQHKSNEFRVLGIAAEITALSKENTRIYLGIGVNATHLSMKEDVAVPLSNSTFESTATWKGPGLKLNAGFMQYFGNSPLGINLNVGLDAHNFDLKKWETPSILGLIQVDSYSGTLKANGVDFAIGLVYRIRQ